MKTRKNRLLILLAALVMTTAVLSENNCSVPVYLERKNTPHLDGTKRPTKAPCNIQLTLAVSYDTNCNQLLFTDSQHRDYYYMVVDENSNIISEGGLDFICRDCVYVSLDPQISGTCTLIVWYGEYEFYGTFAL